MMVRLLTLILFCWPALGQQNSPAKLPSTSPGTTLPVASLTRETPVDFEREILPALKDNCLACHNTTKAKGGLNLETPQLVLKGGDTGPGAIPGNSSESLLFKAAAHLDPELIMPPRDNKANASNLNPDQLALLKLWIDQGAKGEVRSGLKVNWLEKPPALDPIFSVALTDDGQFAACGRGSRIEIYHVPSQRQVATLADPKLTAAGFRNAAHRDYVNSLAFSPDGTLLASAGFREAKLWRGEFRASSPPLTLSNTWQAVAISPDGKWLATDTPNHRIALYSVAERWRIRLLNGHSAPVTALSFSPDGLRLCSVAEDKTLRVWNTTTGALLGSSEIPSGISNVVWTSKATNLASVSAEGFLHTWTANDLKPHQKFKLGDGQVIAFAALPNSPQTVCATSEGSIRIWNIEDEKMLQELPHGGEVTALAVHPNGKVLASCGTNGITKLWNREDGKLIAELKGDRYADEKVAATERALVIAKRDVEFHTKSLEAAEAEGKKQTARVNKATETNAFTAKIFGEKKKGLEDAQAAKLGAEKGLTNLLAEIQRVTTAFESADQAAQKATSDAKRTASEASAAQLAAERASLSKADAERIAADTASVAAKAKAAVSNADAAKETAQRIAEESFAVAEKSKAFAQAVAADAEMKSSLAAKVRIAADKAIEQVATLSLTAGTLKPAYDQMLADAPRKRKEATNQIESTTKALATAESEFKKSETRHSVTSHELELALQAATRSSNSVATVQATLKQADTKRSAIEKDAARLKTLAANAIQPTKALAFSPDGMTLATASADGVIQTWNAETGAPFDVFRSDNSKVPSDSNQQTLVFFHEQTLFASKGSQTFSAWSLSPEWKLDRTIGTGEADSQLTDRVNALGFTPDGKILATGAGEPTRSGEIKLWTVADGQLTHELTNIHSDAVLALAFSPDGERIASASADRFARVVDWRSNRIERAFEGHTSYVLGVAWRADGRALATAGADNVIKMWDVTTGERRKNIEGAAKEVTAISFVGVTDQVVAASGDRQVRLIRENGDKVRSFEGAEDFVNAVGATPDGAVVIAGGQDGVLHVWNGKNGKTLARFSPSRNSPARTAEGE